MSLNRGEINALNVLGIRKLSFIPTYFAKIVIEHKNDTREIENWIDYNLNGRFSINSTYSLDSNNKITKVIEIGFEDPKELVIFTLGCQILHKLKKEF